MGIISGGHVIEGTIAPDAFHQTIVAGAAAGNVTVTGIHVGDRLVSVLKLDMTDASETGSDLTSEFTVTATNTIHNTGGTASTGGFLIVSWFAVA